MNQEKIDQEEAARIEFIRSFRDEGLGGNGYPGAQAARARAEADKARGAPLRNRKRLNRHPLADD